MYAVVYLLANKHDKCLIIVDISTFMRMRNYLHRTNKDNLGNCFENVNIVVSDALINRVHHFNKPRKCTFLIDNQYRIYLYFRIHII